MRDFRQYDVWQRAIGFCKKIYSLTPKLPQTEKYGLISQLQRASVSISSNIAEGCSRKSEKEFAHFIEIALGSSFEVESLLHLCKELEYMEEKELVKTIGDLQIIQKELNTLYSRLK